jgi:hypothetical protein
MCKAFKNYLIPLSHPLNTVEVKKVFAFTRFKSLILLLRVKMVENFSLELRRKIILRVIIREK